METNITNIKNMSIQRIMSVVSSKYPNYQSNDFYVNTKMSYFTNIIKKCNQPLTSFNFVDYSISYISRTDEVECLADDIINLSIIFNEMPRDLATIPQENIDNYLKIIRETSGEEIRKLNKIVLNNEISSQCLKLKRYFDREDEYLQYMHSTLTTALWRLRVLKQSGRDCNEAIAQVKEEVLVTLNRAIESMGNTKEIKPGLVRVLKPKQNRIDNQRNYKMSSL